jgi:predicted nucleotidyltransferase
MIDNRKYGLLEKDIESIISVLKSNSKIESAILFGSRAIGNFKPGSDIDIALKGKDINLSDILGALYELDKLSSPYKFDLVIYHRITENALIDHIERVGILLY